MVTNSEYKDLALQIGKLYCSNDLVCSNSVKSRLTTNLSNTSFQEFLAYLPTDKVFSFKYLQTYFEQGKVRAKIEAIDLVKGLSEIKRWDLYNQGHPDTAADRAYAYRTLLQSLGYTMIEGAAITSQNYPQLRVMRTNKYGSYGIEYQTVDPTGGGTTGGGYGGGSGSGGTIKVVDPPQAVQTSNEVQQAGFDLQGLISNPIVLIGAGVLLFVLLRK